MNSKITLLVLILFPSFLFSQVKWNTIFGTEEFTGLLRKNLPEDLPSRILQNNEGCYYISGTNSLMDGDPKPKTIGAWIAKFNPDGKLLWWRLGNANFYYFSPREIAVTSDGGIIATGSAGSGNIGIGKQGITLFKFDKDGNLLWQKEHDTKQLCDNSVCGVQDGYPHYIFTDNQEYIKIITRIQIEVEEKEGYTTTISNKNIFVLVTCDENGNIISTKQLPFSHNNQRLSCQPAKDGIYIAFPKENNVMVYKLNYDGSVIWQEKHNFDKKPEVLVIGKGNDDSVIIFVSLDLYSTTPFYKIFKIDKNKNLAFEKDFIIDGDASNILELETGELVLTGSYGLSKNGKFFLKKLSSDLKPVWVKDFGQKNSRIENAISTIDGGYALVGYTKDYNAMYLDAIIIKTDKDGNTDLVPKKYTKAAP